MKSKKSVTGNEAKMSSGGADEVQNSSSQRDQMIATAAYFRAEKRGFYPNDDQADWFESEVEIDKRLHSLSS